MRISDWSSDVCSSDLNGAPCTTHGIVKLRFLGRLGVLTNMLVEETSDLVQFHLTNGLAVRPSDLGSELLGFLHPLHGFRGFLGFRAIGAGSPRWVDLHTVPFTFWVIKLLEMGGAGV